MAAIFRFITEYFNHEPIVIQIVWFFSCVLFLTIITLIFVLKLLRIHLKRNEVLIKRNSKKHEELLINYLYADKENSGLSIEQQVIIKKLRKTVKNNFLRKIFITTLLKLKNEVAGEISGDIESFYQELQLDNYAFRKLKNKRWYNIADGIRELNLFHVRKAHKEVIKHVNHSKREVRKEVQLYLVKLFNFKGLVFLDTLTTPLSEWDQIQLLEELQKFENQEIPDISSWLKSENTCVVIFALKLAKVYNQFEAKETLLDLLSHEHKTIKIDVIKVLAHLQVLESKKILKQNFITYDQDIQKAIIFLIEELYEDSDDDFLIHHMSHKSFEIKFSTLKMLSNYNKAKLKNIKSNLEDLDFVKIVEFLKMA